VILEVEKNRPSDREPCEGTKKAEKPGRGTKGGDDLYFVVSFRGKTDKKIYILI